jgi:hypothetical protein
MQHTFTSAGTHQITVSYSGDANYTTATSPAPQALDVVGPISVSAGALNALTPGQSGSATVTVTPNGGFTGAVNLTCAVTTGLTGYSDLPTCSIPSSVTLSGTAAAAATLTVNTTAASRAALILPLRRLAGGGAVLAALFLFGIPARRRAWRVLLYCLAVVVMGGAIGCGSGGSSGGGGGGGGNQGTTPGSYTVTVTGTDAATGKITAQATVSVTVN